MTQEFGIMFFYIDNNLITLMHLIMRKIVKLQKPVQTQDRSQYISISIAEEKKSQSQLNRVNIT
ncbi:unnamed protein product [Paramecium octaurelia]|uniref:Uncharacterized protein n=1 Tax=Paramecium octaurelia TaxID=43137 RepID=A0A8S1VQM8_PAROT|nr:unnamed protein product [Paramecium octaurelia]